MIKKIVMIKVVAHMHALQTFWDWLKDQGSARWQAATSKDLGDIVRLRNDMPRAAGLIGAWGWFVNVTRGFISIIHNHFSSQSNYWCYTPHSMPESEGLWGTHALPAYLYPLPILLMVHLNLGIDKDFLFGQTLVSLLKFFSRHMYSLPCKI